MTRIRVLAMACLFVALCGPLATGDDKPGDKDSGARVRGQLPQNWGKLGLSEEQKQKVYKTQDEFQKKMDDLQKQLAKLRTDERKDLEKILTAGQRERLREIVAGKAPADDK